MTTIDNIKRAIDDIDFEIDEIADARDGLRATRDRNFELDLPDDDSDYELSALEEQIKQLEARRAQLLASYFVHGMTRDEKP
jgi:hypothetical protein